MLSGWSTRVKIDGDVHECISLHKRMMNKDETDEARAQDFLTN